MLQLNRKIRLFACFTTVIFIQIFAFEHYEMIQIKFKQLKIEDLNYE